MSVSKTFLVNAAAAALIAGGMASCASDDEGAHVVAATSHGLVVCNAYNECWRVHARYTNYPADQVIVYHDDAWWAAHQHDSQWRFEADPSDDHGYYDRDGVWHPFADLGDCVCRPANVGRPAHRT